MQGTVANTDHGWYEYLRGRPDLSEINFWSPSPRRTFRGDVMTPFFFRLKAPFKAIAGFAYFARFERLPVWLAWDAFGAGNGTDSLPDLVARLEMLRRHIRYEPPPGPDEIGCCILLDPVLFPKDPWVPEPSDWRERTQGYRYYDLESGEGQHLWDRCRDAARADLHRLFDRGYVTVTPDLSLRVSPRLKRDFHNGRSYYPYDDQPVRVPNSRLEQPNPEHLEWHGRNVFLG
jgi:hypothetical protein